MYYTFNEYKKVLDLIPQLFIPTRDMRRVMVDGLGLEVNGGVYFFDVVQRLIFAILAVQTVVAFQKFSEKS